MLKLTTWNVNGVRKRRDEVVAMLAEEQPDVLCLQELKAAPEQLPDALSAQPDYWCYWHGNKGGYSGVALLLRRARFPDPPQFAHPAFDHENRIVTARAGELQLASIYVPNGNKDLPAKVRFLDALDEYAQQAEREQRPLLLCGDLNVAREERDVHPSLRRASQIGQTAEERAQLERIIGRGLVDLSRQFEPDNDRLFSWWAPWRNLRERNIGWRLDYVLASRALAQRAESCQVRRELGTSDHGPVTALFAV